MQNLANHTRLDPPFHFFVLPVFAITLIGSIVNAVRFPGLMSAWIVVFVAAVSVAAFKLRTYPLKAQDRVIRLEERLRLSPLLPEPLRARIGELDESQLVALRFACDAEIPSLVEKTLAGKLKNADIKKLIQTWRPDEHRI